MTHKIFLDDSVIIRRQYEVPKECARCGEEFTLGKVVLKSRHLWPREEQLMLTTLTDGKTKRDVVQVKDTGAYGGQPNQMLELRCQRCNHLLAASHSRSYELSAMDRLYAFKLRNLLYDSNARDQEIQRKCFDETQGYHGDCLACNIEAEIGTEEVPHPIDPRIHTCKK